MHLISFLIHSPMNHTILSWANSQDERVANLGSIGAWQGSCCLRATSIHRSRWQG